ncbi:hypothetical protein K8I61_10555 [bacterium]|nr:hypothetical protein [bacterium]
MDNALRGMQRSWNLLDRAARSIAKSNGQDENLVSNVVDLKVAKVMHKANVEVLKTGDEMTGTIVDIVA